MNCQRALEVLGGFSTGKLDFTAGEIEELLKFGLVAEADPEDIKTAGWLEATTQQHVGLAMLDPRTIDALVAKIAEYSEDLESDWSRFTTRDKKLAAHEKERRDMRRALALLRDDAVREGIAKLERAFAQGIARDTPSWLACTELGDELYALTAKGRRVHYGLAVRADRYRDAPLGTFIKAFEKTEAKMDSFGTDIAKLGSNIGYVRKNPHQVVIGLAKAGGGVDVALDIYHRVRTGEVTPDVAVTAARNARDANQLRDVAHRLRNAEHALERVALPTTIAKVLLPYGDAMEGVNRLLAIRDFLVRSGFDSPHVAKWAARLMPAEGTPEEVAGRATLAREAMVRYPSSVQLELDPRPTAVALGSMVRGDDAIEPLVIRFRAVEAELVRAKLSTPDAAGADALECVACGGTPREVVDTVAALVESVARQQQRAPLPVDVKVAVAFAKRFAY